MKPIPVLLVTHNRLAYTVHAFDSIVNNTELPVELTIWDNASHDGTQVWLKHLRHPAVKRIHPSPKNVNLAKVMNDFFRANSDSRCVAKVDNDTVLPNRWLENLLDAFNSSLESAKRIGAISGTCLRPNGWTFEEWVEKAMLKVEKPRRLYINDYVCGTGVLINMDIIRERGLLFEGFPCVLAGWTDYQRAATEEGWRFAFHPKVPMNLLNLKYEHVPSGDFPLYDEELKKIRDEGNAWWESVGGLQGAKKYIEQHGGLPRLEDNRLTRDESTPERKKFWSGRPSNIGLEPLSPLGPHLTHCDDREERSTPEWWERRVEEYGVEEASFGEKSDERISEFTERHKFFLSPLISGKKVLEVGCGTGRLANWMAGRARKYYGVDFNRDMINMAICNTEDLPFKVADARDLSGFFADKSFEVTVAVCCATSFDHEFDKVIRELKRVTREYVVLLEEEWMRVDWCLKEK